MTGVNGSGAGGVGSRPWIESGYVNGVRDLRALREAGGKSGRLGPCDVRSSRAERPNVQMKSA